MPERWPQVCRVKIMFGLLSNNWFVSTKMNSMKCLVNWIPLNTHVRFNKTQPYLDDSWKSENRVSKSKIEFPALASIESVGF